MLSYAGDLPSAKRRVCICFEIRMQHISVYVLLGITAYITHTHTLIPKCHLKSHAMEKKQSKQFEEKNTRILVPPT